MTAPGKTSQTPTVPTVSTAPVDLAAASSARIKIGRCGECVLTARHQLAACVAAFALDEDAHAGRCCDVRDKANVNALLLEQRTLFDVQFDKLVKVISSASATDSSEPVNPA